MDSKKETNNKTFILLGASFLVLLLLAVTFEDWRHLFWKKPAVGGGETSATDNVETPENGDEIGKESIGDIVKQETLATELPEDARQMLSEDEKKLIAIHDTMRVIPPTTGLRVSAPTGIEAAQEGLIEVKRMIEPGSTEEILGILENPDIYPGRIVSITSLARPDYNLSFSSLGGLSLHKYNVFASAITPKGIPAEDANKNPIRFDSKEVEGGIQDMTRKTYEFFLQDLQSKSGNGVGNGHVELIVKTAKSLEEGCQKLGIHLAYKGFSSDFDRKEAERTNKEYLFLMLKHEYFQVQSSISRKSPTLLTSRVDANPQSIQDFTQMATWKLLPNGIPFQEVPAVVDVVTYGRIVLVASERAIFDEQTITDFAASYKNPSVEGKLSLKDQLNRLLEGSTYKVITWGGGAEVPPNPLGSVEKEAVTKAFLDSLADTINWSPTTPGRPIGFKAKYLNQASTIALSHNFSDKDVIGRKSGYPVEVLVEFFCGNDMDGLFRGMGEWKIKLTSSEDSESRTLTEMSRIGDGDSKPQWRHPTTLAGLTFNRPLTLTISAKEDDEDESETQTFAHVFQGVDFSQVPKVYEEFSQAELKTLTKSLADATNKMFELRRFGDIHVLTEDDVKKRAGTEVTSAAFMDGYKKAKEAAIDTDEAIEKCRAALEKAKEKWKGVREAVEKHEIVRQSVTQQDNYFKITLKPNPLLTINAVNTLFDTVDETLTSMKQKLQKGGE